MSLMAGSILTKMDWVKEIPDAFLDRQIEKKFRWLGNLWIVTLYIVGAFFWGNFLNWTRTPLDFEDWGVINSPRLDFFADMFRDDKLPLHMVYPKMEGQEHPLHRLTDRYLAIPDVITTPQILLLKFLSINKFIYIDILINFTIATFGLLWFRQKYNLSLLAYGVLFLLFNFNGYIQSHYAIGHITWAGYFLFPLFIALLIQFVEGQQNWIWVSKLSFLLCYMVLAGSQHHFTWALIFLGVFALVCWDKIKWIIAAGFFAGLLSAVRLLPPILIISHVYDDGGNRLLTGYPTIVEIFRSLVILVQPSEQNFVSSDVSWLRHWEFDIYIGLIGSIFIIYFGIFSWVKNAKRYPALQKLFIPTLVVLILTIGHVYSLVRKLHIPLLDGERVPSRMIGLPLVVVILIAVIYFQNWLDEKHVTRFVVWALGFSVLFLIGNDLWTHAEIWNLESMRAAFGPAELTLAGSSVGNHPDQPYFMIIILGTLLSTLTGLFLLYRSWREYKLTEINS